MLRELTETQKNVLRELQGDLPDSSEPYEVMAERVGIATEEFISVAGGLIQSGYLRKVCALVNHLQAGFSANAMCVWRVPPERVEEAGEAMAGFEEVTHCYSRPVSEKWAYAIFSMIHGRSRQECEQVVRRIANAVNPIDYRMIYSTRELKKRSLQLPF